MSSKGIKEEGRLTNGREVSMRREVRKYLKTAVLLAGAVSLIELALGLIMGVPVLTADGLHTMLDVLVLTSLYIGLGPVLKPPDLDHPYGHYKYRYLSMYTVAIVIIGASLWLVAETAINVARGIVERAPLGSIYVVTVVVGLVLSRILYLRVGYGKTRDLVLSLEFKHALADLVDSLFIAATIAASEFVPVIQPIAVFAIAAYLIYLGYRYFRESVSVLLDQVNPDIASEVYNIAKEHNIVVSSVMVKNIGNGYAVDVVARVPGWLSVEEAHELIDRFEDEVTRRVPSVISVNTHIEPQ
jgi:cation diffusion facilitator family transporter